jgi:hypothetical protein
MRDACLQIAADEGPFAELRAKGYERMTARRRQARPLPTP